MFLFFFVKGGRLIATAEGTSIVGGVWGYPPPQKIFKFGGSETPSSIPGSTRY